MTTARFLFNDYFHKEVDSQTGGWGIAYKSGNASDDSAVLHTLRDGRLYTSQQFSKQGTPNALLWITDDLPYQVCDAVGLINTTLVGANIAIGQTSPSPILAPNHLLVSEQDSGQANVFIDATEQTASGSVCLMYIGCAHDFAAFYPRGWKPPFIREYDTDMLLSEDGYPMVMHRRPKIAEYSLPIKFVSGAAELRRLETLLYRMQSENFLFQWDTNDPMGVVYSWATKQGEIKYDAPGLVSVDMRIKGRFDYVN